MKRILTILLLTISVHMSGQKISFYKSPLDSVVMKMEEYFSGKIFFVPDTTSRDRFTIRTDDESKFLLQALDILKNQGYSVTMKDGNMFILKGVGISTSLPLQYFQKSMPTVYGSEDYLGALSDDAKVANFANKVYEIGREENCKGGKLFLSGKVQNVSNGEPLVGVSVYSADGKSFTQTDEFGQYKLQLPSGANKVIASGFSLNDVELDVRLYETGNLDIIMKEKVYSLNSAVVSAESSNNRKSNKMGVELVRIGRIKHVPTVLGEADVLKVLVTLPGVKSVGEASGGFNVRGGATDQNLILFNDGTIYNPTHLFGLFSAFNPDVVTDVELFKSSIPAEYGGRLSSVLEIRGREGNEKKVAGSLGVGLLTAKGHIEGPFTKKGKTKFILGARTTYSDWMLGLLPKNSGYNQGTANFYDANASISHKFNNNNSIYAYGYYSKDKFSFSVDTTYSYYNINGSLKFRSNFSEKHSMVFSTGYDEYGYNVLDTHKDIEAYNLNFRIQQAFAKFKFKSVLGKHTLNYGLTGTYYYLTPGTMLPYNIPGLEASLVVPKILDQEMGAEAAAYISDTWDMTESISADIGVRYSAFANLRPFTYYGGPEFRVSAKFLLSDKVTLKAGYNSMRQYIHMLSNTTTMSPTDIWKLSDADIKPQTGWQAAMALYAMMFNNNVEFSLEGYYKSMDNYLDYKSGSVLIMNSNLVEDVIETRGRAYGAEVMLKKPLGKLNGWVSYTYSRTLLQDKQDAGSVFAVNGGEWYPAAYDKPHDVKFVGNFKFTHRYSISMNVDYSTGRPTTIPVGKYVYGGGYRLYYSDRNAYRIPDYFRMDLALNIEPSHNLKKLSHFSITMGVYNVTGRKNAYSIYYDTTSGEKVQGYMLTIFGAPIPYINLNVKF